MRLARNFDEQCSYRRRRGNVFDRCQKVAGHPSGHAYDFLKCIHCGIYKEKNTDNFWRGGAGKKFTPQCKSCNRRPHRRKLHAVHVKTWREKNSEKTAAHDILNRAVKRGTVVRPDHCLACGAKPKPFLSGRSPIQAHHWHGYNNPLDVVWLCVPCHRKADKGDL